MLSTYYYIHQFTSFGKVPFKDVNGKEMGLFADTCNFCTAALEGTACVKDSSGKVWVLNYAKRGDTALVDCRICTCFKNSKLNVESWGKIQWMFSEGYGNGVEGYKLVPFRTIAVDDSFIDIGSVVYIPEAKGRIIQLDDSTVIVHDGYFFAADRSGAIKQNHIDVFIGTLDKNPFLDFVFSNPQKTFDAFLVKDSEIIKKLSNQHLK